MPSTTTTLYLIRHGQVAKSRPRSYHGQLDVPLSPLGHRQMDRLAEWAASMELSAVYCSDLQRTRLGADLVGRRCAVPVSAMPVLREKHFGLWEGLTYEEAEARFPAEWQTWLADPWDARPPEGETYREVEARVIPFVRRLMREHAGQAVLILAHGGVNRVIVCRALGLPMQRVFGIEQDYACVNAIECSAAGRWQVTLMNSALPGDPLLMTAAKTGDQAGNTG